jgi:hypothetical protein
MNEKEINEVICKMEVIKNNNYKKYGYEEPHYEKVKQVIDYSKTEYKDSIDFKNYMVEMKKRAKYEKTKPGNAKKMEYEVDEECKKVNILEDNIFLTNVDEGEVSKEINVEEMSEKELLKDIFHYIKKKNIILDDESMEEIRVAIQDPLFERKKYIKYSRTTRMLNRLVFLRKMEDDTYEVNFEETEEKNKKYSNQLFFK